MALYVEKITQMVYSLQWVGDGRQGLAHQDHHCLITGYWLVMYHTLPEL